MDAQTKPNQTSLCLLPQRELLSEGGWRKTCHEQRPRDPQQEKTELAWPACVSSTYSPGKNRAHIYVFMSYQVQRGKGKVLQLINPVRKD